MIPHVVRYSPEKGLYKLPASPENMPTPGEMLAYERTLMNCTPAQMRLALHRLGHLSTVQGIADSDPEASIVWEYATVIDRQSPLIDALGLEVFTAEEIDEFFRVAMAIEVIP